MHPLVSTFIGLPFCSIFVLVVFLPFFDAPSFEEIPATQTTCESPCDQIRSSPGQGVGDEDEDPGGPHQNCSKATYRQLHSSMCFFGQSNTGSLEIYMPGHCRNSIYQVINTRLVWRNCSNLTIIFLGKPLKCHGFEIAGLIEGMIKEQWWVS